MQKLRTCGETVSNCTVMYNIVMLYVAAPLGGESS